MAEPAVSVDWGALDAAGVGSADANAAPIHLIAPPRRAAAIQPSREKPAAPKPPVMASVTPAPPRIAAPAVSAPAAPAVAAPAPAAPQQVATAAIPRAIGVPGIEPGRALVVRYAEGSSEIPPDAKSLLDGVAATLAGNDKLRLQLAAYASGSAADMIAARRLSLTRAIEMRAYLIGKGVPSVRMEVHAFGDQNVGTGPPDRVDLMIVAP
ncbi:MAG TPA: OmpA family protein [Stellaceae bacterium]|nr:OmpA family protein [Stellaceae bacterium]